MNEWIIKNVEKMLNCKNDRLGYLKFQCKKCGETKVIKFSCNTRICTRCGKRYTDKWSQKIAQKLIPIPHRHFIFTIPAELWYLFEKDTKLWKMLLDAVKKTFDEVVNYKRKGKKLILGMICVFHNYGSDLKFNSHVHVIVAEGGMKRDGKWKKYTYFKYDAMRMVWQYNVLTGIKKRYKGNHTISKLVDRMFQKYKNGFVIDGKRRISNMKDVGKYVVRYVRHPAIADSRILKYDGKQVQFKYKRYVNGKKHYYKKTMDVNDFIGALVSFIPPKNFKIVRYYGIYSRRSKIDLKNLLNQLVKLYGKLTIYNYTINKSRENKSKNIVICPFCGDEMELVEIYYHCDYG